MIINDHISNYEIAKDILRKEIIKHLTGHCDCQERNGVAYPCKANEWLWGALPSKQVVEDYYYEKARH